MKPATIRLSEREFACVRAVSRLHPETLLLVHAVLVDGRRQVDVAAEVGKSRAWVQQAVAKFIAEHQAFEKNALPARWLRESVALPRTLWPTVRRLERQALAELRAHQSKGPKK